MKKVRQTCFPCFGKDSYLHSISAGLLRICIKWHPSKVSLPKTALCNGTQNRRKNGKETKHFKAIVGILLIFDFNFNCTQIFQMLQELQMLSNVTLHIVISLCLAWIAVYYCQSCQEIHNGSQIAL